MSYIYSSQQLQRPREGKQCAQGTKLIRGRTEIKTQDCETPESWLYYTKWLLLMAGDAINCIRQRDFCAYICGCLRTFRWRCAPWGSVAAWIWGLDGSSDSRSRCGIGSQDLGNLLRVCLWWENSWGKALGSTRQLWGGRMGREWWKPRMDGGVISSGWCCEGFRDWVSPQLCWSLWSCMGCLTSFPYFPH